ILNTGPLNACDQQKSLLYAGFFVGVCFVVCGSGLARDSIDLVLLQNRSVCIASKPAPTGILRGV
ncbi:hypothetical protein ACTQNN_22590, partial [Pseudomonas bubulae]